MIDLKIEKIERKAFQKDNSFHINIVHDTFTRHHFPAGFAVNLAKLKEIRARIDDLIDETCRSETNNILTEIISCIVEQINNTAHLGSAFCRLRDVEKFKNNLRISIEDLLIRAELDPQHAVQGFIVCPTCNLKYTNHLRGDFSGSWFKCLKCNSDFFKENESTD